MFPATGTPPEIVQIRRGIATPDEIAALSETLSRAFAQDAHINWIVRQDDRHDIAMRRLFELLLGDLGEQAEIFASTDLKAAAIWFPPDVWNLGLLAQIRVALRFAAISGWKNLALRAYGLNLMEAMHPKEPHYFLQTIGVDPTAQGKGYGTALLETLLSRCDKAGLPAYLETSNATNVVLYERFGFRVVSTAKLPQGPALYQMLRTH